MKKIIFGASTSVLFLPMITAFVLACNFNFLTLDLASLGDYDWAKEEPYFPGYQKIDLSEKNIIISGDLPYAKGQRYLDYKNFNTGFKNLNGVQKQAVTGAPLNSAFLPNGNFLKDFGEKKKSLLFEQVNSLLDWDPKVDHDAKYNQGDVPYIKSKKVASKWVDSQDGRVQTQILGLGVRSTSGMSSVVGTNRMFDLNFTNWQYTDRFVAWAGAASEGIIVPPAADEINAAHANGTKIYGQVFLDGYHGLTKAMLRDFLKRDANGDFQVVDVLIAMARYMGFDGWFWNNEPNGSMQNGLIMDSQNSVAMINQFYRKIATSSDEATRRLELILYKDHGTLESYSNGNTIDMWADKLANANHGLFVQDFGTYPNNSATWSSNHPQFNQFDIHNMYNLGGWINGKIFYNKDRIGTRDVRELTQKHFDPNGRPYQDPRKEKDDGNQNKWTFKGDNINSITVFQATTAFDFTNIDVLDPLKKITLQDDIYATMYASYYDDMIYTGQNRYLTNNDRGTTSWEPSFDTKGYSYGVGNLVQENTILFDDASGQDNIRDFKTNFSTGQGQMFISDDGRVVRNYPWNNRRLFDTQPTYKWDIHNDNKAPINITGFYDYYHPYRKGNAIALGDKSERFDKKGEILPFALKEKINWNIMGANYQTTNKEVTFKYKLTDEEGNQQGLSNNDNFTVKILVTLSDGKTEEISGTINEAEDDWVTISANLASIGLANNRIAKLGLSINPINPNFDKKINFAVGEMTVNFQKSKNQTVTDTHYIGNLTSENAITRDNKTFLRLNWDVAASLHEQIAYYELYLQKGSQETFFVGQTTNNNYFLKNLDLSPGDKIIIKTINKFDATRSTFQSWSLV